MGKEAVVVGILALQGDFAKHSEALRSLGVQVKEVRKPEDLEACQGLIIPGGESTVILRQMDFIHLKEKICQFAEHKPVFGTCAGLIVMSKEVQASNMQPLGLLNVTVERNAFGRQVESFQASIELHLDTRHPKLFQAYFIRAPRIKMYDANIQILATYQEEPILVRQGYLLGASFHPELTSDPTIHQYFLNMIESSLN